MTERDPLPKSSWPCTPPSTSQNSLGWLAGTPTELPYERPMTPPSRGRSLAPSALPLLVPRLLAFQICIAHAARRVLANGGGQSRAFCTRTRCAHRGAAMSLASGIWAKRRAGRRALGGDGTDSGLRYRIGTVSSPAPGLPSLQCVRQRSPSRASRPRDPPPTCSERLDFFAQTARPGLSYCSATASCCRRRGAPGARLRGLGCVCSGLRLSALRRLPCFTSHARIPFPPTTLAQ